ncbi:interleukin-7 receptor subunit alpha [Scyliorhinus torazame]|uniref:interleukin-7 receptor subunit alpha n=1 Tax=Scyliorhinus torazame TaxID=75743 RepID=UPI003B5CA832
MVKPGPPFNVTVAILMEAEEIELVWDTPSVRFTELTKGLVHQLSYRSPESEWEHLNVTDCSVRLLMKNLIPNSDYIVRIRSLPDQIYFRGMWSDWSQTVNFKTPPSAYTFSTGMKLTISLLILLLIFLFGLSALLWENRIKPHIWPKIPNPKCALEQLHVKPNKMVEVSFNPSSFLDVMVSRVDMIQVKGARMCHLNLSAASDAAECNSIINERELLLLADPIVEKIAANIRTNTLQSGEHPPEPPNGDTGGVEPERGGPVCQWASGPPSCLSPGIVPEASVGTPCNSLGPLAGQTQDGEAACVQERRQVLEGPEVRDTNLGSTFAGSSAAPPDESYITMSNLYKIQ